MEESFMHIRSNMNLS